MTNKLDAKTLNQQLESITKAAKVADKDINALLQAVMSHSINTMEPQFINVFIKWAKSSDTKKVTDYPRYCLPFIKANSPWMLNKSTGLCTKQVKGKNALKRLQASWSSAKDAKATIDKHYAQVVKSRVRDNEQGSPAQKRFEREALLDNFRSMILRQAKAMTSKPLVDGEQPITRADIEGIVDNLTKGDEFQGIAFAA